MRASSHLIRVVVVALVMSGSVLAQDDDTAVREAFEAYRTAILASDGQAALKAVDAGTVAYYEDMLDLALDGDSVAVAARPMLDRLMVLAMRVRVPVDSLRAMDGASTFAYGVEKGWIGRESVRRLDLGLVTVEGDRASASVRSGPTEVSELQVGFVREEGPWRVDLTSFMATMSTMLSTLAEQQRVSEDVLLAMMLEAVIDGPLPADAWLPVGRP